MRTYYEREDKLEIELIKLEPNCKDRQVFEQINKEAFPLSERMSMDEIFSFAANTDTDVLGIYDVDTPVGFTVILKNKKCGYVYYLAIDKRVRSKGYGGAALEKLFETYPWLQIILDFEEIDANAENSAQRLRRKEFYLRNGFHETGCFTMLNGARFEVVCSGGELRKDAFKDLLNVIHAHRPEFPNVLI